MKTVYRQRLILGGKNEARWIDSRTGDFEPLDELLEQNVNNYRSTILDRAGSSGAAFHKQ